MAPIPKRANRPQHNSKPAIIAKGSKVFLIRALPLHAEKILEIRHPFEQSGKINQGFTSIKQQQKWMIERENLGDLYYLIAEKKQETIIGTIRIYKTENGETTIGSWTMKKNMGMKFAIEGLFLAVKIANDMEIKKVKFSVRKENKSVLKFHKKLGANIISKKETDVFLENEPETFIKNASRFYNINL